MATIATTATTPVGIAARWEMNPFLVVVAAFASIAGALYGYDTGIISGALLQITKEFHLEHGAQELIAAAILVGAVTGALTCSFISSRIGRKRTVIVVAVVFVTGAIASSLAPNPVLLALARAYLGFAVGGASQAVPVYVAELSPAARRGRLVTCFNVAIGTGIVAADLVGFLLRDVWSWRVMIAAAAVPAAVLLVGMFFLPESPRYLISKGRTEEAANELSRVRKNDGEVAREVREIQSVIEAEKKGAAGWRGLFAPWVRPALIAGFGCAAFTQLVGIEMMIYYAPTLLLDAGFKSSAALLSSVGLGLIYLVMTAVGLSIVDKVGRRRLTLIMTPGAAIALAVLGTLFMLHQTGPNHAWLVVTCLFVFMVFDAGGIQVIGWLLGSELYPLSVRSAGASAQAGTLWGTNLLITGSALTLVNVAGLGGAMWVYAGLNVLAILFVSRFLPETAGRSLEQIEHSLRDGTFNQFKKVAKRATR
jgi:sugar porter (SP) family MFS transporter